MSTEVLVTSGRRSWPIEVKRKMIAEAAQPGSSVSAVARAYNIDPGQLYQWRKKLKADRPAQEPVAEAPIFYQSMSATGGALPTPLNQTATNLGAERRSRSHAACICFCRLILIGD